MYKLALTFLSLVVFFFSCQKGNLRTETLLNKEEASLSFESVDAQKLVNDNNFRTYISSFNQLTEFIIANFNSSERRNIIKRIESEKSKNLTNQEQYHFLANELKFSDESTLRKLSELILTSYRKLQISYGPNLNEKVFSEALNGKVSNSDVASAEIESESGCGWRYAACSASVTFQGGLLLAACEAATAGLGTPLCLVGAVAYAADGIAECSDKYCN